MNLAVLIVVVFAVPATGTSVRRLASFRRHPHGVAARVRRQTFRVPSSSSAGKSFKAYNLVPDLIDAAPPCLLDVTMCHTRAVTLGNLICAKDTLELPTALRWASMDFSRMYTVLATDPDGEFVHWLVVNVNGNCVQCGRTIVEWMQTDPSPGCGKSPRGAGCRRQVCIAPRSSSSRSSRARAQCPIQRTSARRRTIADGHSVHAFRIPDNQLGTPVAGNFYLAACDD